jgi:membrane dipeptidase
MRADLNRRQTLGLLASCLALPGVSRAQTSYPLADVHSHLGLVQKSIARADFLEQAQEARLGLMAWCVVPDGPWLRATPSGIEQRAEPGKGQLAFEFNRKMGDIKSYLQDKKIPFITTAADVDEAMTGKPYVVLSSEGADFLEGQLDDLPKAHAQGLRHLQLVHYIRSPIGDLQTIAPRFGGLTPLGQSLVAECNKLGMLIDLAHSDPISVEQALEISKKPMIWSHGWVSMTQGRFDDRFGVLARRLALSNAKKISDKGGIIGLWSLGISEGGRAQYPEYPIALDPNKRHKTYAEGIAKMVKELGADHVCFGTDIEGVGSNGVVNYYRELRLVANLLSDTGLSDSEIQKVCIGNYARVLKAAMSPN